MSTYVHPIISKTDPTIGMLKIEAPRFNALSLDVFKELGSGFDQFEKSPQISAIIVIGTGSVFSAGVDVKMIAEVRKQGREVVGQLLEKLHALLFRIQNSEKLVVMAVNGICYGGGLELALVGDYIIALPEAEFQFPEIKLGIIPGLGGTQRLPRLIGVKEATEMILSCRKVDSREALGIGLINKIVKDDLVAGAKEFIADVRNAKLEYRQMESSLGEFRAKNALLLYSQFIMLAKGKPEFAATATQEAIFSGADLCNLYEAIKIEQRYFLDCLFSPDGEEGLGAFVEGRQPEFSRVIGMDSQKTAVAVAEKPPWEEEEYRILQKTVRDFARREVLPQASWMEENRKVPEELIKKISKLGLFGVCFEEKYGGADTGKLGLCLVAEELGYADASVALVFGAHVSLACSAIALFGSEDQKQRYLVPGILGEKIGAFAVTEQEAGSDVGSMRTIATKVVGGWSLNGTKQFITNGETANFVVTAAQTEPTKHNQTLALFIVDPKTSGFKVVKCWKKMGLHASKTNDLVLENVFVPDANVLVPRINERGELKGGFKAIMKIFNHSRVMLGACCLGFIQRAIDEAIAHVSKRKTFGEELYKRQDVQLKLAKMQATLVLSRASVYETAWKIDRDQESDVRIEASAIKFYLPRFAKEIIDVSLELHGGPGYMHETPIERFYRDVKAFEIFEGATTIQLLTIANNWLTKKLAG